MVCLRCGLQQSNQHRSLPQVGEVAQGAHDLEGGGTVQAGTDLIQEERLLGADQQLPSGDALPLPTADTSDLVIANQGL